MSLLVKKTLNKLKDIDMRTTTGQEVPTNEYIDGKRIYKKTINCGNLPNNSLKTIAINSGFTKIIKIEGIADASGIYLPLPYVNLRSDWKHTARYKRK